MSREDSSKVETTNQSKERASASDVKVHSQVSFAQILHEFCVTKKRERERDSVLSFLYFNFLVILVGGSWWLSQKRVCFTLDLWFHFQGKRKGILIESQTWADSLFLDLCLRSSWAECCSSSLSLIYKFVKKKKKFVFVSDLKWETTRF